MTGATPAQAAAHAFVAGCVARGLTASVAAVPGQGQLDAVQELWADVARDAVAAFIEANGCDPVDAAHVIAEAIVPELAEVTAERDSLRILLARRDALIARVLGMFSNGGDGMRARMSQVAFIRVKRDADIAVTKEERRMTGD